MRFIAVPSRCLVVYSFEMVLVGMILLSAMVAGGIVLRIRRGRDVTPAESTEDTHDNNARDTTQ